MNIIAILLACGPVTVKIEPLSDSSGTDAVQYGAMSPETTDDSGLEDESDPSLEDTPTEDPDNPDTGEDSADSDDQTEEPPFDEDPDSPDPNLDSDNDGVTDLEELDNGTDPYNEDTDSDGMVDGEELYNGTDPLNPDTDDDGLTDGEENLMATDPLNPDSDADGLTDGEEVQLGTDPLSPDDNNQGNPDDWDWGEPVVDSAYLAGIYPVQFQFVNSHTGYLLCDDVFDIEILTDGSLNFTHPCVTPNGSVLDIEQDFVIHSIVDYAQQYGQHYNYVYGYLNGSAHVTVPSGAVFSTSGQFNTSGQVVESGGNRTLSISWTVDIDTPSGLRTYHGSMYTVH